jgi:hypothetical protein
MVASLPEINRRQKDPRLSFARSGTGKSKKWQHRRERGCEYALEVFKPLLVAYLFRTVKEVSAQRQTNETDYPVAG